MARERLTKRLAAAEGAEGNGGDPEKPFPGTVNQPDRKFVERDHYHTFEHTVNHELPDMRHDWQNDQRDEIGFPIPTVASIRAAASKAVKLAVLLLGDKVEENTIEAQARDFMKMGSESLNESLKRFADSENLYKKAEEKEEEKVEAKKAANPIENLGDKKAPPFTKEDAKKAEDKEEVKAKKSEDKEEEKVEAKKAAELDIQLTAAEDEEEGEVNAAEEKLLASIFEAEDMEEKKAEDEEEKVEAKKASEKKGVSKLGGQPKVASEGKEIDLSNLWESAPDVSKLFE